MNLTNMKVLNLTIIKSIISAQVMHTLANTMVIFKVYESK